MRLLGHVIYPLGMQDRQLYAQILGIERPWRVTNVEFRRDDGEVLITVAMSTPKTLPCPRCGSSSPGYDSRERRWRHLDTCQYRTILIAELPRVRCAEHGVLQMEAPWAEPGSRFTALFEAVVIDWLQEANFSAVARQLRLSWGQVAGIQERAVRRGLARRGKRRPTFIGIDETSFQRRHEYVTVVIDQVTGDVLHVADDRKREVLDEFYQELGRDAVERIEAVSMDMWAPYIRSTQDHVPDADRKIVFDKFHIAQHLGAAVDKIRRQENRALVAVGDERLKGTKYLWLTNPERITEVRWRQFGSLRSSRLKVARAWAMKEAAMMLWGYKSEEEAEADWKKWYGWAIRCRLEPMKRVARMIRKHWKGVMNAVTSHITNAASEGTNSKIQRIKRMACGFRNRDRFRNAIYFHLGGLDLYPNALKSAHSKC